jgi:hypothetical protein
MKKALIVIGIVLLVFAGLVTAGWLCLPTLASHLLAKAVDGSVEAAGSSVTYRNGVIIAAFKDVRIKGKVEGSVGNCELQLQPLRGFSIKYFTASDFNVSMQNPKGSISFYPIPIERAVIRNGSFTYGGKKYIIRELRVSNFNTDKPMEFSLDGGIEGLGNLKSRGEGLFRDKRSDIKGDFSLTEFNVAQVFRDYEGLVDARGTLTYKDGTLSLSGEGKAARFLVSEKFLKKPIVSHDNTCRFRTEVRGGAIRVILEDLSYKGVPVALDFTTKERKLHNLELKTGFLLLSDATGLLDMERLTDKGWGPFCLIRDGEVRIRHFAFNRGKPFQADIDLKGVKAGEDDTLPFYDIEGSLKIEGQVLALSHFKARIGNGEVRDVSGTVPLTLNRDVDIKGKYHVFLRDLAHLNPEGRLRVLSGETTGDIHVYGRQNRTFNAEGAGTLSGTEAAWETCSFGASGNYRFKNALITFSPLMITGGATELAVTGKVERTAVDLRAKGLVGAHHVFALLGRRYPLSGSATVDGRIAARDSQFSAEGTVGLTDLSFEVPHIMKKGRGITSSAVVALRGEKDGTVHVDRLSYTLDALNAEMTGSIAQGRISNARLRVDAPRIERVAEAFFLKDNEARGELKADIQVQGMVFPVVKLPVMKGYASLRNAVLRFPAMAHAFRGVNLTCSFEGERFSADVTGLKAGTSVMTNGHLSVAGVQAPSFTFRADFDRFDSDDFAPTAKKNFFVPVIDKESLMARTSGTFVLRANNLRIQGLSGQNAVVTGTFSNRRLAVKEARAATGEGDLSLDGTVVFADEPQIHVVAKLRDVKTQEAFSAFGGKANMLGGTGSIYGDLTFRGMGSEALLKNASGMVSIYSRDGHILKWNILSKLLALTNLYDLVRGRVDLAREGLVYRRLSALFQGKDGVFHTNNFLIDSPSMIIAGRGDINLGEKKIDGEITVSPLVATDKFLDRIPLVRSIVKEEKTGFLFFVYDVKGPLQDPDVRSTFVQSLGTRVVYIMRNILLLPKEAFYELPKELFEK